MSINSCLFDRNCHPHKSITNQTSRKPQISKALLKSPELATLPRFLLLRSKSMAPCCVEPSLPRLSHSPDRQTCKNLNLQHNRSLHARSFSDFSSCRSGVRRYASSTPVCTNGTTSLVDGPILQDWVSEDDIWSRMAEEAMDDLKKEPILSIYYTNSILSHNSLDSALAYHLSSKLGSSNLPSTSLVELFMGVLKQDNQIIKSVEFDLRAVRERDPACISYVHCFLFFKGFLACQAHRIAHRLWIEGRKTLALLIQSRVAEVFAVDIHPGARIGRGILLDHATGLVIGETAVIGNNVSILHNVTLGGTGKENGDRHPKIGDGVLIGAGTCVLGSVRIGDGAKVGAGSVVLKEVPERTTAVGNPAKLIGGKENPVKLEEIPSLTMDHTSYISEWSDYVI